VFLLLGTSSDAHLKLTAGYIPAQLKCLFIVENTTSSIIGPLALAVMFATEPIRQTAGMVIVEKRHQPLKEPLHNERYRRKRLFGIETSYIVLILAIQRAVHRLPLTPQPESSHWNLSNTIDLNAVNVFYM
jgi:hypothetical protein